MQFGKVSNQNDVGQEVDEQHQIDTVSLLTSGMNGHSRIQHQDVDLDLVESVQRIAN